MTKFPKRLLGAALSLFLTIQPLSPASCAAQFPDVSKTDWFYTCITDLSKQGMIAGYDDGKFHPEDTATVGMAALLVLRVTGCEDLDSSDRHWAAAHAERAVELGFLEEESIADLEAPIPRGDIARMSALALGLEPLEGIKPFEDTDDGLINALYDMGIVSGVVGEDGVRRFFPEENILRSELAAVIWQVQRVYEHGRQILYGGRYLDIADNIPPCSYDRTAFRMEDGRLTYTGEGYRTVQGIDVSYYQEDIDWERVAADGIEFAILRGGYRGYSYGLLHEDTYLKANLEGALAAGLDVGVYFFSQAISVEEALEEAEFLLECIQGYELTYPVVFDWENISGHSARTDGLDAQTLSDAANAFCQRIAQAGYQPMIYFNLYIAYRLYDIGQIGQWPFWLAQYTTSPTFYYDFEMWQYTSSGRVDGIEGRVDMDIRLIREETPE